jgi:hypothetical protein
MRKTVMWVIIFFIALKILTKEPVYVYCIKINYKNNEPPIKLEALIRSPFGSIPRFT